MRVKKERSENFTGKKPPVSENLQTVRPHGPPQLLGEEQRVLTGRHSVLKPQCLGTRQRVDERGGKPPLGQAGPEGDEVQS